MKKNNFWSRVDELENKIINKYKEQKIDEIEVQKKLNKARKMAITTTLTYIDVLEDIYFYEQ